MPSIDITVATFSNASVSFGLGVGYAEVAGGSINSWSHDATRPRSCGASLTSKPRVHFVVGGSIGQFFNIGINRRIEETIDHDNFDCVFGDGDTILIQGITLLFVKIGRIKYNLKHLNTSRFLFELNLGLELSSIRLKVQGTS